MKAFVSNLYSRIAVTARYLLLRRQLAEIVRAIEPLNVADRKLLQIHVTREMEISARESREASTTNAAFARARSDNSRLRVLGIAQWIASAFRETESSPHGEIQDMHRQLMRTLRLLKESLPAAAAATT